MKCIRCEINGKEIKLFDAIYNGRMELICERCAIIENIPMIKKPNPSQLRESEEKINVYDRMKKLAGIRQQESGETYFQEDKIKELDENPELERPEKEKLNLIDNFHWEIMKHRRRKGLSPQQLAETLGESEIAVQMIEKGKLPENPEPIIRKLEQFFQTKLRHIPETEKIFQQKQTEPALLDEEGFELEVIPEEEPYIPPKEELEENPEEIECRIEQFQPDKRKMICNPPSKTKVEDIKKRRYPQEQSTQAYIDSSKDLDIKKIDTNRVTIEQLKELHEKKLEKLEQEHIEEQRKKKERKKILDGLREQDRIKREQARQQAAQEKQRQEQERLRIIEQKKQEIEQRRKQEADDIDKLLGGSELLEDKPDYRNN